MQFGYVPPRHAIAENLLINPRGKINQANEPDGVIAAGDYFCDGWKAGPAGCEVYIEPDGFRLVSGSMLQLIPNTLESDRLIRTNLDVISGSPVIKVNGVADKNAAGVGEYIEIEISGLNSKFSRIIAADSKTKPIYQQSKDELVDCKVFFQIYGDEGNPYPLILNVHSPSGEVQYGSMPLVPAMKKTPALIVISETAQHGSVYLSKKSVTVSAGNAVGGMALIYFYLDARP
ncbi:hypothetical protein B9J90_13415 [Vibrio sp. V09_P4A23P171]|uniref:hypothetical protein n=1 Tax=Vibrio sp. V09_P4A23P171 TaxID=1938664 RepID=UPI000B8E6343|nr:hypothetical protein [Vibrio sp. V09_P4A23P171]OXX34138.1 hypothetical protein B9J90_13415 [Vibrio sp. V09_P4A23P171]